MVEEAGDMCRVERRGEELVGCSAVPHLLVAVADFPSSVVLAMGDPHFFGGALVVPATERAAKRGPCPAGGRSSLPALCRCLRGAGVRFPSPPKAAR